ncbi:DUF2795 domain-containing protein [Nonomuraea sp. NPDC005650]|uniref:DUF2795 domain-containing protein n=1 Tax=Nonomuraea sp. NPDC005650 TaxID=3157045 RepID=UPI00339F8766
MTTIPNPIDLLKNLSDVEFPANKQDLLRAARQHKASKDIIKALETLPDHEIFDDPSDVTDALSTMR